MKLLFYLLISTFLINLSVQAQNCQPNELYAGCFGIFPAPTGQNMKCPFPIVSQGLPKACLGQNYFFVLTVAIPDSLKLGGSMVKVDSVKINNPNLLIPAPGVSLTPNFLNWTLTPQFGVGCLALEGTPIQAGTFTFTPDIAVFTSGTDIPSYSIGDYSLTVLPANDAQCQPQTPSNCTAENIYTDCIGFYPPPAGDIIECNLFTESEGITPVCKGQPYLFNFTVITPEKLGNGIFIEKIKLITTTGLPNGLSFKTNVANNTFLPNTTKCASIEGICNTVGFNTFDIYAQMFLVGVSGPINLHYGSYLIAVVDTASYPCSKADDLSHCTPNLKLLGNKCVGLFPEANGLASCAGGFSEGLGKSCNNFPYNKVMTLIVPDTIKIGNQTLVIDSVLLINLNNTGLPNGFQITTNNSQWRCLPNSIRCIEISGTPTVAGAYPVKFSSLIYSNGSSSPLAYNYDGYELLITDNNQEPCIPITQNSCEPNPLYINCTGISPAPFGTTIQCPEPGISNGIPPACLNKEYSFDLTIKTPTTFNDKPIQNFTVLTTIGLPDGLQLTSPTPFGEYLPNTLSCAKIKGTPTKRGIFPFKIKAQVNFANNSDPILVTYDNYFIIVKDTSETPCSNANNLSICEPSLKLIANNCYGLFPAPKGKLMECLNKVSDGLPNACVNNPYFFTYTFILPDSIKQNGNLIKIDSIKIKNPSTIGLPNGLVFKSNSSSWAIPGNSIRCYSIEGQTSIAGTFNISLQVDYYVNGNPEGIADVIQGYVLDVYPQPCTVGIESLPKNNTSKITVVPNPTNNKTILNLYSSKNEQGNLIIYDAIGKVVFKLTFPLVIGENKILFDAVNLSNGIYFANFQTNSQYFSAKFVKE